MHEWRRVPGAPAYTVSADGLVRGPGGLLYPVKGDGVLRVEVDGQPVEVARLVLGAFTGPQPTPEHQAFHIDGDPTHNAVSNLSWRIPLQAPGRARGERNGAARLTAAQAEAIRLDKRPSRAVGAEYGIAHTTVLTIRRGTRWKTRG